VALEVSCPRCTSAVTADPDGHRCPNHGEINPLLRPTHVGYDAFAEMMQQVVDAPTYLPWPMSPGWSIADFACVGGAGPTATVTTTVGTSALDGHVEVTIVSEDPGVGLGARCAAVDVIDPGGSLIEEAPAVRVRAGGRAVALWPIDGGDGPPLERSVFAGECDGRWLWLVMRPASAALLLHDEWLLADVTGFGPEAIEMPFGGDRPTW
jgi:hypothetical protein